MTLRKLTIQQADLQAVPGDTSGVRLGNLADQRHGASISAGFGRYGPSRSGSEELPYDEVIVVLDGSLSVRDGDDDLTAAPGELLFLPQGTTLTFTAGPEGAQFAFVTHPHWQVALGIADGDTGGQDEHAHPGRPLVVIGAPTSAAGYCPGQEKTPAALRAHGLVQTLSQHGVTATDAGDTRTVRWHPDPAHPHAANLEEATEVVREVAEKVSTALAAGSSALVVGGDCTVGVGTVAGLLAAAHDATHDPASERSVGLVYIDGDVDLHVPATGEGVLDWMGVAHLLDIDGACDALADVGPHRPMLRPEQVLFIGPVNITAPERDTIARLGLHVIEYEQVRDDPNGVAELAAQWSRRFDRVALHVDFDVLDYTALPVAVGTATDRRPGLQPDALARVMRSVCAAPTWRALTIAEIDPDHAPDPQRDLGAVVDLLAGVLIS